jgi:putative DNA primase/helicase
MSIVPVSLNPGIPELAASYASRGWAVFPAHSIVGGACTCRRNCNSPGKHPLATGWQKQATTDKDKAYKLFKKHPLSNIAIATGVKSRLLVVDIDPDKGGNDSLKVLIESYPDFIPELDTYIVSTGGDGRHYYYECDIEFSNRVNCGLGKGIDIRADGGFVIAPPSNHKSGGIYKTSVEKPLRPLSDMMINLIGSKKEKLISDRVPEIFNQGCRNDAVMRHAGELFRQGISPTTIQSKLYEFNAMFCDPPLDTDEVESVFKSVQKGFIKKGNSFKTAWEKEVIAYIQANKIDSSFGFTMLCLSVLFMDADGKNCWPSEERLEQQTGVTKKNDKKAS